MGSGDSMTTFDDKMTKLADCIRKDKSLTGKLGIADMIGAYKSQLKAETLFQQKYGGFLANLNVKGCQLTTPIPAGEACTVTMDFDYYGYSSGVVKATVTAGSFVGEKDLSAADTSYQNLKHASIVINIDKNNALAITNVTFKNDGGAIVINNVVITKSALTSGSSGTSTTLKSVADAYTQLSSVLSSHFSKTGKLSVDDMIALFNATPDVPKPSTTTVLTWTSSSKYEESSNKSFDFTAPVSAYRPMTLKFTLVNPMNWDETANISCGGQTVSFNVPGKNGTGTGSITLSSGASSPTSFSFQTTRVWASSITVEAIPQ